MTTLCRIRRWSCRFIATTQMFARMALIVWVTLSWAHAAAQQSGTPIPPDNTGSDSLKPPHNLFQMAYQYETTQGSENTRKVTNDTLHLRLGHLTKLTPPWGLVLRAALPLVTNNPISSGNPDGTYVAGVGDAYVQSLFIHDASGRTAVGFGARLILPSGGDDFGSGKWQLMPIVGMRAALPEINSSSYLEPRVRFQASVAGDPMKKNIRNLQFAPTFNLGLPDHWFITLYPSYDIRVNLEDTTGQKGRLFLPFDAWAGRKLSKHSTLSIEVGVPIIRDYPVFDFETEIRLNVTY